MTPLTRFKTEEELSEYLQKLDAMTETNVAALRARVAKLEKSLGEYIENFDNDNISSSDLKNWLDEEWIPHVRLLMEAK